MQRFTIRFPSFSGWELIKDALSIDSFTLLCHMPQSRHHRGSLPALA